MRSTEPQLIRPQSLHLCRLSGGEIAQQLNFPGGVNILQMTHSSAIGQSPCDAADAGGSCKPTKVLPILLSALVALFDQISRVKFNQTAKNALPVHFVCLDQNFPLCAIPDGCRPLLVQARRQLVLHVQLVHTANQYFGRQQIVILRHVQVTSRSSFPFCF